MDLIQKLGFFVVLLGVLVFVHELGHFLVAKLLNVKVLKFSIGFGPRIFGFTRGETEYRVAWIPLGGYVKMAGEQPHEELPPEEARRGFLAQPPWKRGLIVLAGPAFNLLFPILVYFFVYLGPREAISTRIGTVEPGLPAAAAKLQPGDRILAVDGEAVQTFDDLRAALQHTYDREVSLTVERDGKQFTTALVPARRVETSPIEKTTRGLIGISPIVRPPLIGVPSGSPAEAAGLKTFDRILTVNGKPVEHEVALRDVLAKEQGPLTLQVARVELMELPGAALQVPKVVTLTDVPKLEGEGFAALGVEWAELYVASTVRGSPAEKAGLLPGDRLVAIDGKEISSSNLFHAALQEAEEKPFKLEWRSGGVAKSAELAQVKVRVFDELDTSTEDLDLGVRQRVGFPEAQRPEIVTLHMGPSEAFVASLKIVPEITRQTVVVIAKLFTGKVPFEQVGGPLMLYQIASKSAERGLKTFLSAMAVLSINLGLMNLLPIPILDGFHLLAALWEGVRRRPIPVRAREVANMVGLALLAVLMVMVLKNDITRMFLRE